MKSPHALRVAATALASFALAGCSTFSHHRAAAPAPTAAAFQPTPLPAPGPLDPSLLQPARAAYRVGPGDQLEIQIVGDEDTRTLSTVGPDGKVYFYILPGIDVWGLTLPQIRQKIEDGLHQFVRDPQPVAVTLRIAQSDQVWVLGRLNKPGLYPIAGPTTLLEAIAEAGGLSPRTVTSSLAGPTVTLAGQNGASDEAADLDRAFLIRNGKRLNVDFTRLLRDGDMAQNVYLQPGDFVYLPGSDAATVQVLGAVLQPQAIQTSSPLTLAGAVSSAGGTIRSAYLSHVAIVRGSLSRPQVAIVDLDAIQHGQAPDIALQPEDIVYVPFTPYHVLTRYVDRILDTFARTVGVNEGARAVTSHAVPVGVNVPVGGL